VGTHITDIKGSSIGNKSPGGDNLDLTKKGEVGGGGGGGQTILSLEKGGDSKKKAKREKKNQEEVLAKPEPLGKGPKQ